jgi:hypothetical protein
MAPFSGTTLKAAVASVVNGSIASPGWHDETCGGASAIASPTTITTLGNGSGNSVIIVQVTFTYTSALTYMLPASITLTQSAYARPRNAANVTGP